MYGSVDLFPIIFFLIDLFFLFYLFEFSCFLYHRYEKHLFSFLFMGKFVEFDSHFHIISLIMLLIMLGMNLKLIVE